MPQKQKGLHRRSAAKVHVSTEHVLIDERALLTLSKHLRAADFDHAVFSGWRSVDLLASGDRRARAFVASVESALNQGRRVSFLIGGALSNEDFIGVLAGIKRVLRQSRLREHFKARRLILSTDHDNAERQAIHAKCWLFLHGRTCRHLFVGSFNLSAGSFLNNLEAAAPATPDPHLVAALLDEVERGRIDPGGFASIEDAIVKAPAQPKGPPRDLSFLTRLKKGRTGRPPASPPPPPPPPEPPSASDYWVVLKDPSRGERIGYKIPAPALEELFGKAFIGREETATGVIEPPRALVVPFPRPIAKRFQRILNRSTLAIQRHGTATSVGYVVNGDGKEKLEAAMEDADAIDVLEAEMRSFMSDAGFRKFLVKQARDQVLILGKRFSAETKLTGEVLRRTLAPYRATIIKEGLPAAHRMIERLRDAKELSFIELEVILANVEGVDRADVMRELGSR